MLFVWGCFEALCLWGIAGVCGFCYSGFGWFACFGLAGYCNLVSSALVLV